MLRKDRENHVAGQDRGRVLPFTSQINYRPLSPAHNHPLEAKVIFCVRGAVSPTLANLFLHYAFDMWMVRTFPHLPFERYADDVICHCKSAEEARALWGAIADRFAACKLVLHPQKTKIVYCKDVNRRSDFPDIYFDFLGFQFRARKIMWVRSAAPHSRFATATAGMWGDRGCPWHEHVGRIPRHRIDRGHG
jgi:Reverse transcriptase (RNA-dependent DNA polymerase)